MSKLLIFVSLMIIAFHLAEGMSCRSCGIECVSACGTRRFRTCCFNYLRRKRVPDTYERKMPNSFDVQENPDMQYSHYLVPEDLELWWQEAISRKSPKFDHNDDRSD